MNDLQEVIAEIARVLKPNGLFFYDTINRTFVSKLLTIKLLQEWRITCVMPPNLHDWHMFIKPRELHVLLKRYGLVHQEIAGLVPNTRPLTLLSLMVQLQRGTTTFQEVGSRIHLVKSKNTANLYMGYACKVPS